MAPTITEMCKFSSTPDHSQPKRVHRVLQGCLTPGLSGAAQEPLCWEAR